MAWEVILQEEGRGEDKELVPVKHVRFFPRTKTKKVAQKIERKETDGFGKLKFLCLSMKLQHTSGAIQRIGWSNHARQPYGENCGSWKWVFREKSDEGPEESTSFAAFRNFCDFLEKRVGEQLAMEIVELFTERIMELMGVSEAA